jgi:hypothetical protein
VIGIRGHYERSRLHGQQVVFPYDPQHTFVIDQHPASPQLGADPSIPVSASVLDGDLLNHAPYLHVFLDWCSLLQRAIKTGSADPGQLTHSLDA